MSHLPIGGNPAQHQLDDVPVPTVKPTAIGSSGKPAPEGLELFYHVLSGLECGNTKPEIRKQMIGMGYTATDSQQWVEEIAEWRRLNPRASSRFLANPGINTETSDRYGISMAAEPGGVKINTNMWAGGAVFLIGSFVTLASCVAASQGGGGRYVIAWGAIVVGAIWFFRGLTQYNQEKQAARAAKSDGG
jgi:hypothetical protein